MAYTARKPVNNLARRQPYLESWVTKTKKNSQPQRTQISAVINTPFIQSSNRVTSKILFIHLGGGRQFEICMSCPRTRTQQCPRPGLELGMLALDSSALNMGLPRLPQFKGEERHNIYHFPKCTNGKCVPRTYRCSPGQQSLLRSSQTNRELCKGLRDSPRKWMNQSSFPLVKAVFTYAHDHSQELLTISAPTLRDNVDC